VANAAGQAPGRNGRSAVASVSPKPFFGCLLFTPCRADLVIPGRRRGIAAFRKAEIPFPARGRRRDDSVASFRARMPLSCRAHTPSSIRAHTPSSCRAHIPSSCRAHIPSSFRAAIPPSFRTHTRSSFRAEGEESRPRARGRSLALARDDKAVSFRAAGEESPPFATPRSFAFARDDSAASFRVHAALSFRAAIPPSFRTHTPSSFRAEGEESRPRVTQRSLAFARDDKAVSFRVHAASSFRAEGEEFPVLRAAEMCRPGKDDARIGRRDAGQPCRGAASRTPGRHPGLRPKSE